MSTQMDLAVNTMETARRLQGLDSLDAIPQLAQRSRRFPGWLTILTAAALVILLALATFTLCSGLAFSALWIVARALQGFVTLTYPGYKTVWVGCFVALLAQNLWQDERWRELLQDKHFELSARTLNRLWTGILWPLRIAAEMLRLFVALSFLALILAPGATAITAIVRAAIRWQMGAGDYPEPWTLIGFTAGALYLILGLFLSFRRKVKARWRPKKTRPSWMQAGMAAGIAAASGLIVMVLAPDHKAAAGGVAGALYFLLWSCWLVDWNINTPRQLLRRPHLGKLLSEDQTGFLSFTSFLLWLVGLLLMNYHIAAHWHALHAWLPGVITAELQRQICSVLSEIPCGALQPWQIAQLMGRLIMGYLFTVGLARLINLDLALARPFAWPFFAIRAAAEHMMARVRARLAILAAVRHHCRRNQALVGKRGQRAVCREHLARFKLRQVRLAYGLRWRYWSCRYCSSDAHAIPNVAVLRAAFDQDMQDLLKQEGDVLAINMLRHATLPLDLQEIFVARVEDDHDVEKFITTYENHRNGAMRIPELSHIRLRISPESNLGDNQRNMLRSKCRT